MPPRRRAPRGRGPGRGPRGRSLSARRGLSGCRRTGSCRGPSRRSSPSAPARRRRREARGRRRRRWAGRPGTPRRSRSRSQRRRRGRGRSGGSGRRGRAAPGPAGGEASTALAFVARASPAATPATPKEAGASSSRARARRRKVAVTRVARGMSLVPKCEFWTGKTAIARKVPARSPARSPKSLRPRSARRTQAAAPQIAETARLTWRIPSQERSHGQTLPRSEADRARDVERQGAVRVELRVELRGREGELVDGLDDPSLVRVVVVPLVPGEAEDPDGDRAGEEEDQKEAEASGPFLRHQIGSLRKRVAGSARRTAMIGRQNHGV